MFNFSLKFLNFSSERKLIKGVTEKLKLVYVSTMEPAVLESLIESEDENAAVPQENFSKKCVIFCRYNILYINFRGSRLPVAFILGRHASK